MKIQIENAKCQAYGNCADEAPHLFLLDAAGYASTVDGGTVPAGEEPVARTAALSCPAQAIKTVD